MGDDRFDPNKLYQTLMKARNIGGKPMFSEHSNQEFKVAIRPDKNVSPAKFVPDPLIPGGYKANPVTIRAMRKDIFVGGADEFIDLECLHECHKCGNKLDLQFWIFCPYCEAEFKL